jgi:hypothetical protein
MRVISRVLCSAGLAAAMLVPSQAHALLNSQCGSDYSGTTQCMFTMVGPNVWITGNTSRSGITVLLTDPTGTVTILSCEGTYSCSNRMGIDPTGTDSVGPPQGVGPLLCTVITQGSGYYRCQSTI